MNKEQDKKKTPRFKIHLIKQEDLAERFKRAIMKHKLPHKESSSLWVDSKLRLWRGPYIQKKNRPVPLSWIAPLDLHQGGSITVGPGNNHQLL